MTPSTTALAARLARAVLLAAFAVAAPLRAAAADIVVSWDKDLAFEWDRANYERLLRQLVTASDAEVSAWLGWQRTRPLELKVLTKARYEAQFGSEAAWSSGAHYRQGAIHVNGGARLDDWFGGMLTHELTHAYVDDLRSGYRLPQWLNEGLATRLGLRARGQDRLTTGQVTELEVALQQKQLVPLPVGGGMTPFRYLQGFAAVLFLESKIGKQALLALVQRTMKGGTFEQALDAELRWTPRDVEERFSYWVDHLQ